MFLFFAFFISLFFFFLSFIFALEKSQFLKKFNIFNTLFGFKKCTNLFVQLFKRHVVLFEKCTIFCCILKICSLFQNLFVIFKNVHVFKFVQIFNKVLEFHICSHFSKIVRIFRFSCLFLFFFRSPLYFVQKFQILFGISKVFSF